MFDRWKGLKIDLKLLCDNFMHFFEKKGFSSAVEQKSSEEYRVIAVPERTSDIQGTINVSVRGAPDDFVVEFTSESDSRHARVLGGLATFFGGGVFVLKDLKSREGVERLEKEFWLFVDKRIDILKAVK